MAQECNKYCSNIFKVPKNIANWNNLSQRKYNWIKGLAGSTCTYCVESRLRMGRFGSLLYRATLPVHGDSCRRFLRSMWPPSISSHTPDHESPYVKTRPSLRIGTSQNSGNGIMAGENRRRVLLYLTILIVHVWICDSGLQMCILLASSMINEGFR